jgi:hypothetical protein
VEWEIESLKRGCEVNGVADFDIASLGFISHYRGVLTTNIYYSRKENIVQLQLRTIVKGMQDARKYITRWRQSFTQPALLSARPFPRRFADHALSRPKERP